MIRCPDCDKEVPRGSSVCPQCGTSVDEGATKLLETPSSAHTIDRGISFDSIDEARFTPGRILADRYRIVGLLGRGGMGEVYRADDLKLSQPVALKFLPEKMLKDSASLARFHREVRTARQVSHKNVCRVYDIGETRGHHFLSMEFIKGEELSSLLRRIGRLPQDKALQIARQICAGLAAAHDSGVLHRDLKPANIMIDGDGNARITDFGLAGLAEEFKTEERSAGTPAYMAPEQLAGKEVTTRSDIYSLGLVLYELFTGKRAYDASTLDELMKLRLKDTTPTRPSEFVKDLDPVIERVIERCIQKNPAQRPSSALQVAAALPGGDPIAAALAAGETPSPEMVAAAPKEGALHPAVALSMLAVAIGCLGIIMLLGPKVVIHGYVPLEKSPEILRERAREIIRKAGYEAPTRDSIEGFKYHHAALQFIEANDAHPDRWKDLNDAQPAAVTYWYRQGTAYLEGFDFFRDAWSTPPPIMSGMTGVSLDTRGRLLSFYAVPPQVDVLYSSTTNEAQTAGLAFESLFHEAGLDVNNFTQTTSQWSPLYANDFRVAWQGYYPEQKEIPIRVEAASHRGKPVYFEIVSPWTKPERQHPTEISGEMKVLFILLITIFALVLIGSVFLAIRNLRLGRGDRKGALRLGVFVFALTLIDRAVSGHHIPTFAEFGTILNGLQDAVFGGLFFAVVYLALEPFVRKRWPDRIISWSRLLGGSFRDPLIGRDILIGAIVGLGTVVLQMGLFLASNWFTPAGRRPTWEPASLQLGIGAFVAAFSAQLTTPLLNGIQFLFLIVLLALLFRRDWLGFIIGFLLFTAGLAFLWGGTWVNWITAFVAAGLVTITVLRYGFLAMVASIFLCTCTFNSQRQLI